MSRDDKQSRFLALLRPIEGDLERYCRRMVFEQSHFADALQNAVLRGYRAFDRYREDASFRAWMFKILTNEISALNRKRRRIAHVEVRIAADEIDSFPASASAADEPADSWAELSESLDEEIVGALEILNDGERAVLLLRAIGQLRYREISECMGIPLGSVMGNLSRARQKMRDAILRARRLRRATTQHEGGRSS
ncbi:MAG: RNA polymerase sigma factor [Chthoniobacterales bacterium]